MSEDADANLYVTKIEAARRQLNAAILMCFRDDDELAVHSVANATLSVMREILKKRGKDVHADIMARGLYEMLRAYRKGTLDPALSDEPSFKAFAAKIPEETWILIQKTGYENVRSSLIGFNPKKFWGAFNDSYNFLKHGDIDPMGVLDLDEVDNLKVISYGCAAYAQLGLAPTVEMMTFLAYYISLQPFDVSPPEWLRKKAEVLREYEGVKRKLACRYIIGDRIRSVFDDADAE